MVSETQKGISQLGYLGLAVRDPGAWERVMVGVLGLASLPSGNDGVLYLRMDERHHRFCLRAGEEDRLLYVGWQVDSPSEMESLAERLIHSGVKVVEGTPEELAIRKVAGMVKFEDPSGYPLELFYGPKVPVDQPFQTSRPRSGFRTGELGMGHILCTATDVRAQESFYTRLLGFRVSDYAANGGVFLRCNARHHSTGFHPTGSFGAGSERPQVRHFLLEVNDLDDVGAALDACEAQGVPLAATLGRHSNDLAVSFYLKAPSLLNIEYGCYGRLIDEATWAAQVYSTGDLWGHKRVDPGDRQAHSNRTNPRTGRFPWLA